MGRCFYEQVTRPLACAGAFATDLQTARYTSAHRQNSITRAGDFGDVPWLRCSHWPGGCRFSEKQPLCSSPDCGASPARPACSTRQARFRRHRLRRSAQSGLGLLKFAKPAAVPDLNIVGGENFAERLLALSSGCRLWQSVTILLAWKPARQLIIGRVNSRSLPPGTADAGKSLAHATPGTTGPSRS